MPSNTAEYMRQYMRDRRASGQIKGSSRQVSLEQRFVGCDGEGATLDNGYHAYFMLRIGGQTLRAQSGNVRLSTLECLEFICSQPTGVIYAGFFFDYDVTKILEDLPWDKLDRLMHRQKRMGDNKQLFPIDYAGFQIEYLPKKEFKVRKKLSQEEDRTVWSPWIVISDVGTFFQMSFLRAIQVWNVGTEAEHEKIRAGKLRRAAFDIGDYDEIAEYNALEIRLLECLMDRFRDACVKAGYVPKRWQGPGVLAETMLRAHGVPRTADVPVLQSPEFTPLLEFARSAYYGGRFEVSQIGPVSVPVWQYDINSAYPHAMRTVPCLMHGNWYTWKTDGWNGNNTFGIYQKPVGRKGEKFALMYGTFKKRDETSRTHWYGLPVRTPTGTIVFPEEGAGWYWSFEVQSAIHQEFTATEIWEYTRVCDCQPLGFVDAVYMERKRIGKDGPGLILKLGLNSLYGKTVQSIGTPKYSNAIWASFITAVPRTMIQNFLHSSPYCRNDECGRDVIMVATDSVASLKERHDVEISSRLGAWSEEVHDRGMFIVQPGVYFGSSGKPTKTRGFTRTVVDTYEREFRDAFNRMVSTGDMNEGQVALPVQVFVGPKHALQRRNMKLLGQWIQYGENGMPGKVLSFDWTSKRSPMCLNPTESRPWILTLPYQGREDAVTVPYSKDIGGLLEREASRVAFEGQPDWSPLGDTYE